MIKYKNQIYAFMACILVPLMLGCAMYDCKRGDFWMMQGHLLEAGAVAAIAMVGFKRWILEKNDNGK